MRLWKEFYKSGVEEIIHTSAVLGGDGEYGNTETMKDTSCRFLRDGVDFVHGDEKRLASGAKQARKFFIEGCEAGLTVHNEDEQRGFANGDVCLTENLLWDEGFVVGDDAAGVHDFDGLAAPFSPAID